MSKFAKGDIVVLKSGGPQMTVEKNDTDGVGLWATWFSGTKHNRAHFDAEALLTLEEAREAGATK